jgi:nifR3 family TIM-barrel protein
MSALQEWIRGRRVALAPVASITNSIYRRLCKEQGADYCVTELVSSEALSRESLRSYELAHFTPAERPIAVQIFGGDPAKMAHATDLVNELEPDAIDINMGCPARKVTRNAGGSDLLRDLDRLGRVVAAVVARAERPVSVKIRAGWDEQSLVAVEAARIIESEGAQWMTLHPRTRSQRFGGRARWELIAAVKDAVRIPVIGNGDIVTADDAIRMFEETGCDSVMVGRGCFGYPWIFAEIQSRLAGRAAAPPAAAERVAMALRNLRMEIEESTVEAFRVVRAMRKHLAWYVADLPGSKELRTQIFAAETYAEVEDILRQYAELGSEATPPAGRRTVLEVTSCDPEALESASCNPGAFDAARAGRLDVIAGAATAGPSPADLRGGEPRA